MRFSCKDCSDDDPVLFVGNPSDLSNFELGESGIPNLFGEDITGAIYRYEVLPRAQAEFIPVSPITANAVEDLNSDVAFAFGIVLIVLGPIIALALYFTSRFLKRRKEAIRSARMASTNPYAQTGQMGVEEAPESKSMNESKKKLAIFSIHVVALVLAFASVGFVVYGLVDFIQFLDSNQNPNRLYTESREAIVQANTMNAVDCFISDESARLEISEQTPCSCSNTSGIWTCDTQNPSLANTDCSISSAPICSCSDLGLALGASTGTFYPLPSCKRMFSRLFRAELLPDLGMRFVPPGLRLFVSNFRFEM